jgi:hypothetical protein
MRLGEAFIALGFDVSDDKLKEFDKKIEGLAKNFGKLSAIGAAALFGIERFAHSVSQNAVALRDMTIQTGLSQNAIQKWAQAANLADSSFSFENAQESIAALQKNLQGLRYGQGNAAPFAMMGISYMGQSAFSVLKQLHRVLPSMRAKYGAANTAKFLSEMGINPKMENLLLLPNNKFNAAMKLAQNLALTKQQNLALVTLANTMNTLELKIGAVVKKFGAMVAPRIVQAINAMPQMISNIARAVKFLEIPLLAVAAILAAMVAINPFALFVLGVYELIAGLDVLGAWLKKNPHFFDSWVRELQEVKRIMTDIINLVRHPLTNTKSKLHKLGSDTGKLHITDQTTLSGVLTDLNATLRWMMGKPILSQSGGGKVIMQNTYHVHTQNPRDGACFVSHHEQMTLNHALDRHTNTAGQ